MYEEIFHHFTTVVFTSTDHKKMLLQSVFNCTKYYVVIIVAGVLMYSKLQTHTTGVGYWPKVNLLVQNISEYDIYTLLPRVTHLYNLHTLQNVNAIYCIHISNHNRIQIRLFCNTCRILSYAHKSNTQKSCLLISRKVYNFMGLCQPLCEQIMDAIQIVSNTQLPFIQQV